MKQNWVRQCVLWMVMVAVFGLGFAGCATKQNTGSTPEAPLEQAKVEEKTITAIEVTGDGFGSNVTITGNSELTYTVHKSPFSGGIVLYFDSTKLAGPPPELMVGGALVEKVVSAQSLDGQDVTTRVEIVLAKEVPFKEEALGNTLVVSLAPEGLPEMGGMPDVDPLEPADVIVGEALAPAAAPAQSPKEKVDERLAKYAERQSASSVAPQQTRIRQIDFIQETEGKSIIRVVTSKPVDFTVEKSGDNRLLMNLPGVSIPKKQQRPLITTRFESAADRVIPLQKSEDMAAVSVELREFVPYRVEKDGSTVMLFLDASTIPPRPLAEAGLPEWEKVMAQSMKKKGLAEGERPETMMEALDLGGNIGILEPTKFTGEKIALDFYKTDIKNVFRILKEVSGLNFAIDKRVVGEVTLSLDKPVPWDQVLYLVLKMNQLGSVRSGDIVRIAPLSVLDDEAKAAIDRIESENQKKQAERAAKEIEILEKKAKQPQRLEYLPINYANCKEVADHLNSIMEETTKVAEDKSGVVSASIKRFNNLRCDDRTNTVLIIDDDEDIEDARKMVEQLDRPTPQVLIEARIVEATSAFSRSIGLRWSGEAGIQPGDARVGVGPQRGYDALGGTYGYNWDVNYPTPIQVGESILGFNFNRILGLSPLTLDAKLAAAEVRNAAKIVSAPKVLTLDNKKATIKQGIEYPIKRLDESGNTLIEYKDVDLLLEVTPHVTSDRRVSINIKTTKNDLGDVIAGEQSFSTKEAETELLLNDGDTVVIGGIIKTTRRDTVEGVPWLNEIPVLGWLFKYKRVQDDREELLVFITPRIVNLH